MSGQFRRSRRPRAFTLIELIVVVIIIAVLAAIAGVAYNQFVANARDTAAHASAKQVDTAIAARSAREDVAPGGLVAQAYTAGGDLSSFFNVTGSGISYAVDNQTDPKTLTVTVDKHSECLTLGTEAGMGATITKGACTGGSGGTAPTPLFSTDFDSYADGDLLDTAPWAPMGNSLRIYDTGAGKAVSSRNTTMGAGLVDTGSSNGELSLRLSTMTTAYRPVSLFFRGSWSSDFSGVDTYYWLKISSTGSWLSAYTGAVGTTVASDTTSWATGDVISVEYRGSLVTVKRNGTPVLTYTGNAIASGSMSGFGVQGTTIRVDDFTVMP